MAMRYKKSAVFSAIIFLITSTAYAVDESEFSGFLSGYEKLEVVPGEMASYVYVVPGGFEKMVTYLGIMIDQPEIFISEDSKYKGMKPADMTLIAEIIREAVVAELGRLYEVVDEPGDNVLHMRIAIANLDVKKAKRKLWAYHPVGAAVSAGATRKKSVLDKTNLRGAVIEVEMLDSQSGEIIGQVIDVRVRDEMAEEAIELDDDRKWDLFIIMADTYAARIACRLENVRLPEDQRVICPRKTLEDLIAEMEAEG